MPHGNIYCDDHGKLHTKVVELNTLVREHVLPQNADIIRLMRGDSGMNGLLGRVTNIEKNTTEMLVLLQGKGTEAQPGLIGRIKEVEKKAEDTRSSLSKIKDQGKGLLVGISVAGGLGGFGIGAALWKILSLLS